MLPKIDLPIHITKLPSSGEEVKFRPFIVKEEKILMMAASSDSMEDRINAIRQIVNNCVFDVDCDELPMFDVEFLFLQIRCKSVSNTIEVFYNGDHPKEDGETCGRKVTMQVTLDDVKVQQRNGMKWEDFVPSKDNNKTRKIMFTETTGMIVRYPTIRELELVMKRKEEDVERALVYSILEMLFDESSTYNKEDFTEEEFFEWLSGLSVDRMRDLIDFTDTIPQIRKSVPYTCKECGFKMNMVFEGIEDFFG